MSEQAPAYFAILDVASAAWVVGEDHIADAGRIEGVPNRWRSAIGLSGTFYLIGSGSCSPRERFTCARCQHQSEGEGSHFHFGEGRKRVRWSNEQGGAS